MPPQTIAGANFRTVSWSGPKVISLRERCQGGPVREKPIETPAGALSRSRRVLLLIHGFNVDFCHAEKSYTTFMRELFFRWQARSVWVYWPGDYAFESESAIARWTRSAISGASYSYQPDTAEAAARALRDFIFKVIDERRKFRHHYPIKLSIVAHSLGCRLALELLDLLGPRDDLKIELVVLMAAAVPLFEVRSTKRFDLAHTNASKTLIYFSKKDKTLKWLFRLGQRFYSSSPSNFLFGRAALGRHGPEGILPLNVEPIERSYDHGDYWPDPSIPVRVGLELDGIKRPISRRALLPRGFDAPRTVQGRRVAPRQIQLTTGACDCRGV
jgi:pimeloyl-ACP methyl ester carboxylesterase